MRALTMLPKSAHAEEASFKIGSFIPERILALPGYKIDVRKVPLKLDQNEMVWDWPRELKQKIVDRLIDIQWNRYPAAYSSQLNEAAANYFGVRPSEILAGPGSNYIINMLLSLLVPQVRGEVRIAFPSFPLYETYCSAAGLSYQRWNLDNSFQYNISDLENLPNESLVIFASPNNPVGNVLTNEQLETLLTLNPSSLFIADEAYFEFADETYTDLFKRYHNLILIRTCSKALGAAGLRLGFAMAPESIIAELYKWHLPYTLNHWTTIAGIELLSWSGLADEISLRRTNIIREREHVWSELQKIAAPRSFEVFPSQANFFLMRLKDMQTCGHVYQGLIEKGILVRNVSNSEGLAGCLRVSLGTHKDMDLFLESLRVVTA